MRQAFNQIFNAISIAFRFVERAFNSADLVMEYAELEAKLLRDEAVIRNADRIATIQKQLSTTAKK
jgi:trehalose-6-phosphate synthase